MRSKIMLLVLFSFALVACENLLDNDDDNGNVNSESRLVHTLQRMSDAIDDVKTTNDPDQDFALKMKVHHRGAINMADYEILRGDVNEVLEIADSIIEAHTLEIVRLDSFLNSHTVVVDNVNGKQFNDASDEAMAKLDSLVKVIYLHKETDHDFLVLIIEHHKNGVEIADALLEFGKNEELKAMVTQMRMGAMREIALLEALLEKNY